MYPAWLALQTRSMMSWATEPCQRMISQDLVVSLQTTAQTFSITSDKTERWFAFQFNTKNCSCDRWVVWLKFIWKQKRPLAMLGTFFVLPGTSWSFFIIKKLAQEKCQELIFFCLIKLNERKNDKAKSGKLWARFHENASISPKNIRRIVMFLVKFYNKNVTNLHFHLVIQKVLKWRAPTKTL